MATTNMRIVIRRDTSTNWSNVGTQVVLLAGEQGYETDTRKMKIGNGTDYWNDLPYYAGGIVAIDHDTIIMDAAGTIMLNSDSVIGDLGTAENVKAYVDAKDDALAASIAAEAAAREAADEAEAAVREAEDTALGARIDQEILDRGSADATLQTAISGIGDRVVVLETDPTTKSYVDSVVGAANNSIADVENDLGLFKTQTQAEFDAQANMIIAGDESVAGMLADSVTALLAADDVLDAKFGSLTAPGEDASDNVTDFVGLVTGNLGGVNVKTYSDNGDAALGAQISDLQDMDTTLGSQINERVAADAVQDGRLDALEADSVTAAEVDLLLSDKASLSEANTLTAALTVNAPVTVNSSLNATDIGGTFWGDVAAMPAWTPPAATVDGNSTTAELAAAITDLRVFVNQLHARLTDDQSALMP